MRKTLASLLLLTTLLDVRVGDALCAQNFLSIDTTTLTISGCYEETIYAGTYETKVWTIDGGDIASTGTKAIVADLQNVSLPDPSWVIGTVVSLPQNSWSDGYSAGVEVVEVACRGTSAFWETTDPTEEIQWECDSNGDGVLSIAENGDFENVNCGCSGVAVTTPTPAPRAGTIGVTAAPAQAPTAAPGSTIAIEPTAAPVPAQPVVQVTQAPINGGPVAPTAPACNLTITSTELQDVSGCYVKEDSANTRGKWAKIDNTASIEWQDATGNSNEGHWAVILTAFGTTGEAKCRGSEDVYDPTDIPQAQWYCDLEGEGNFVSAKSFDFEGIQCSDGACDTTTSVGALDGDSSDGSTGTTIAIAVGSVVAGVGVAALIIFGVLFMRKKRRDAGAKGVDSGGGDAPADANAPVPVPVFEPWGTRPAPRYYG